MKKHLLFLTLAAVLSLLPFGAKAQNVLNFGFEDDTIPATWTNDASHPWTVTNTSPGSGHSGTYCISSGNSGIASSSSEISATFTFTTAGSISFLGGIYGEGTTTFYDKCIFLIDDEQQFAYGALATWDTYEYDVTAGTHTFTWKYTKDGSVNPTGDAFFVDNINVVLTNTCPKITSIAFDPSSITSSEVTINWTAGGSETSWAVYLGGQFVTVTNSAEYTFTGLNSNTPYTASVRAVCGNGDTSGMRSVSFRTACDAITLPFYEGFEGYTTGSGNFPPCWTKVRGSSTSPYVGTSGAVGQSQLIWSNSTTVDTVIFLSGAIPISPDNMHISMWLASAAQATVGIMTDTSDVTTFVPLKTVSNGNNWVQYDIYTDTVANIDASSSEVFLVFVTIGTSGSSNLDEVFVEEISDCRRPFDGDFEDITYNGLTIHWTPDSSSSETAYDVLLTRTKNPNEDDTSSILITAVTDTTIDITDLLPNTTYYAWVRANCGGATSNWFRIGSFTTDRSCYELTDVTLGTVNFSSAYVSWNYAGNGRGIPESGVHVIVRDSSSIVQEYDIPYSEGNSAFITGLNAGTTYTIELRTLCDPDTASASVLAFTTSACGQVGDGSQTNSSAPFNRYFKYGYSQILYPMSAVSLLSDGITGIGFSSNQDRTKVYTVDVYIGETDQATLTSATAIPYNELTLVAQGVQMTSHIGYNPIMFDTVYVPTGHHANLVVVVDNNTGSFDGSGYTWSSHVAPNTTLYYQSDATNADPANPPSLSAATYRPDIRFLGNCNLDCLGPNVVLVDKDDSNVELRWARGADESNWAVQSRIDTAATTLWVDQPMATDTFCTVSGLDPRSPYVLRVGTICTSGDTVWGNAISVYTDCAPVTELPIIDDFEDTPTGIDPLCWTVLSYRSSTSGTHVHGVSTTQKHSGNNSVRFSPYGYQFLVSQQLPEGINPAELEISWWGSYYGAATTTYRYDIGLMTDPTDTSTFRLLLSSKGNSATWTEYTVYTDTVTLTDDDPIYVAFRLTGSSNSNYTYIDDITIKEVSCRKPVNLNIEDISHNAITVSWRGQEGATYEYCVTTVDSVPDTIDLFFSEDTVGTVEGLTGNSDYYFWARSVCDETPTPWSNTFTFHTPCTPETTPWLENFDEWSSFSECWERYTGPWDTVPTITSTTSGWAVGTSYGNLNFQGKALYFNLWSTNKYWAVSPIISVSGPVILNFDLAAEPYSSTFFDNDDRFIVAISTNGGNSWQPIYMLGADTTRDDAALTSLTSNYQTFTVPVFGYEGQDVRLAFYGASYTSGGDSRILIDNISLQGTECMRPVNVEVETGDYSADFTWVDYSSNNDGGYILVVSESDSINDPEALVFEVATGDTSFTATGLQSSTRYHYFLRSACGDTVTEASWTTGIFQTNCLSVALPYTQDFEDYSTGSGNIPVCWDIAIPHTSGSTVYPYITTSGNKCLYFYGYRSDGSGIFSIATPKISEPLNNLELIFDYKPYSSSYAPVSVYLATDPTDTSTYHLLASTNTGSTWVTYELFTDTVSGLTDEDTGYVVFVGSIAGSGYTYGYLDNLHISVADPCRRPSSVSVSDISYYTANVTWPAVNGNNGYRVKWSTEDDIETADSMDVYSEEATLTDLHNGTTYFVWVQTICVDGISNDARGTNFTTEISCYPITDVHIVSRSATGAAFEWGFVGQGNDVVEVLCEVFDFTDSTSTIAPTMGSTYHLVGGLDPSHNYVVKFYTVCDPDTSVAYIQSLASDGDACKIIRGTSTVSYAPMYGLYDYSYCQMLYTGSDVANLDTLTGIAFRVASTPSNYPQRPVSVWIGNTTMTSVNSSSLMNQSQMTQVANHYQLDVSDTGWTTINFTQPFVHVNGRNIMIAVQNHTGEWSSMSWGAHSITSGGYTMWYADASEQSYASHSGTNNSSTTTMPDIKFLGNCGNNSDSNICTAPVVIIDSIDSTSAHVIWLPGTDETSWIAEYKADDDSVWTIESIVTGSEFSFMGLNPATDYLFRLGTICDEDTVYSTELAATTECVYEHLPFHFTQADMVAIQTNGFSPCWDYTNFYRSSSSSVAYVYTSSTAGLFILPAIAEPLSGAQLRTSVAATSSSATSMRVGIMDDGGITWVDTVTLPHASSSSDVTEQVVYLDSYGGIGNRVVIGSMSNNYMYFHDFHLEELDACRRVDNLQVSNITESGATVTWTPAEGQTQWLVYVDGQQVATATAATYDITGVASSTTHTVAIRAFCGGADTARAVGTSFTTLCDAIATLPWNEDFTNSATGSMPNCWDQYFTGTTASNAPHVVSSSSYQQGLDGNFIYIMASTSSSYGQDVVVVLPVFSADINTLEMIFSYEYESSSYGTLEVGYITGSDYNSDFVVVETCAVSTDATVDTVNFSTAPATATRIAFRWTNNYSTYYTVGIDNITVQTASAGPGPQPQNCDAPVITSAVADGNAITLSWTGAAAQYQVASTQGAWTNPNPEAVVSATTYTFENLSAGSYTVGVRAVCEDGGFSAWATRSVTVSGGQGIDDVDGLVIALFPNPAAEQVTLQLGEASEVSLVDQSGRTAGRYSLDAGTSVLDLSQYASGVYYVRVVSTSGTSVRKLVVK